MECIAQFAARPIRRWAQALIVVAATGLAMFVGARPASAQADARPNVLVIVTDDQRASGTMQVMPKTRRLFGRGGVRYRNGFAVTPLCCPSRATIFTGRFAHNTGVIVQDPGPLDKTTMFTRLLQEAGYRTAMVGKVFTPWAISRNPRYFDRWATGGLDYTDPRFNVNGTVKRFDGHATRLVGRFGRRFVRTFEANDDAPWFLYLAPHAPHAPWVPQRRHRSAPVGDWFGNPAVLESDRSDKPGYVRKMSFSLADGQLVRRGQLRMLMDVDDMVGGVFRTLANLGEKRRTLAIFVSDNGYLWTEHDIGGDVATGGQKRVPYTQSVKIPFYLRWPGHVDAGRRDDRLSGTVDIAPTILEAAGVAPDPEKPALDGRSLLTSDPRNRMLLEYWNETRIPTWASIRTKRFQYIEYYRDDGTRFFREYYNLDRDPWQLRNLLHDGNAANNPDVSALAAQLRRDRRCTGTTGLAACP